jgi:hypothetical protein
MILLKRTKDGATEGNYLRKARKVIEVNDLRSCKATKGPLQNKKIIESQGEVGFGSVFKIMCNKEGDGVTPGNYFDGRDNTTCGFILTYVLLPSLTFWRLNVF